MMRRIQKDMKFLWVMGNLEENEDAQNKMDEELSARISNEQHIDENLYREEKKDIVDSIFQLTTIGRKNIKRRVRTHLIIYFY